ncbi:FAD-dependent oxidoreductase [Patescibacteria group bacterium]|nr:FAD-dependent oxidoreductase [Patescibacteria group bacterium]MBP9709425.1 FAD-dependent oxidoreductase [Patescibacteria group bacterium]
MKKPRVAVVGAGISGLACAYELQKAGVTVMVFEAEETVGGRMRTRTKSDLSFDIGADHLCELYTDMKAYIEEFGLTSEPMHFSQKYHLFKQGTVIPLSSGVSWRSRLKVLWNQRGSRQIHDFFNLSNVAALDIQDGDSYGREHLTDEAVDYWVDSFVSTYQFHRAKEISSGVFKAMVESARHDGRKWDLFQIIGGMSALPEAIAKRVTVKTSTPVLAVVVKDDEVFVTTKDGVEPYDAVVLATTANVSSALLASPTNAQRAMLAATKYASTISVAFRVPKRLLPQQFVVWVPFVESQKISGYTNQMMKEHAFATDQDSLLCVWLHEDYAKTLMQKSDEKIFAEVKKELLRVCPHLKNGDAVQGYDLQRWPEAMPKFASGHLKRVKNFLEQHQGENNIFLCGDYMNSLWTEGSIRGGKRTASLIMQRFSGVDAPEARG